MMCKLCDALQRSPISCHRLKQAYAETFLPSEQIGEIMLSQGPSHLLRKPRANYLERWKRNSELDTVTSKATIPHSGCAIEL